MQQQSLLFDTANGAAKRAELLERLQRGPVSTYDCEHYWHRGQAVIGTLRKMGHQIETVELSSGPHYVYCGFLPQEKVTRSLQEAYYRSPHWREVSCQRKQLDNFACVQCSGKRELETHHWRYELFNEDVLKDLVTLCQECHQKLHRTIAGSRVHFPRYVSVELADLLRTI